MHNLHPTDRAMQSQSPAREGVDTRATDKREQQAMTNRRPAPHATAPRVPSERQEFKFR